MLPRPFNSETERRWCSCDDAAIVGERLIMVIVEKAREKYTDGVHDSDIVRTLRGMTRKEILDAIKVN